jgi:predicted PurR-regulated permease PerM
MAEQKLREMKQTARRIFLDSSSPSVASVFRVVLVVFAALLAAVFLGAALYYLKNLIFWVVVSVFFAYLINPLVKLIRRPFKERHLEKFMPRSLAIVISYLLVFTVLILAISYLAPRLIEQAKEFASNVPGYAKIIQTKVTEINNRYENYKIPSQVQEQINEKVPEFLASLGEQVTSFAGTLLLGILFTSPWLILVPILSFFFLKDVNMFRLSVLRFMPSGKWRARAENFLEDVNNTLAAYTRAQLISCFLIGTICTIGFYLLGVNYALLLGILAGVLEFIPLIGPLIVAVTATTIASFTSPALAAWTASFLGALRLIHDYVTYPRIVREGIHLHPIAIILSVLAGEQIAGIPGVFLAIPLVAIATVTFKHINEHLGSRNIVADWLDSDDAPRETGEEPAKETA